MTAHHGDGRLELCCAFDFRHHDVRKPAGRARADGSNVGLEMLAVGIVHARADAAETVLVAGDQVADQRGMVAFVAGGSAVLAIEGDVEHRTQLLLQRQ